MSNIYKAFENKKAFIPFVTGGDPDLETTKNLLIAMEKAGADLIEIGIPFSDPIAEGPVIQEASQRALAAGCTTDKLFDMVKEARQRVKIPMVFMTYINPVYTYGKERFMKRCVECGIDGIIVPDLPYEEKEELSFCIPMLKAMDAHVWRACLRIIRHRPDLPDRTDLPRTHPYDCKRSERICLLCIFTWCNRRSK